MATLVNQIVCDLLHQQRFAYAHFPELVDMAVVATGLGLVQSNITLVKNTASYWDSTQWDFPRRFWDNQSLSYVHAIVAWQREEKTPDWANHLPSQIKNPMRKSLKFLHKTGDSFYQPSLTNKRLSQSQGAWIKLAKNPSRSTQIVALRHLNFEQPPTYKQETVLEEKLRSSDRAVLLHAISAAEKMKTVSDAVNDELRPLVQHGDDEVRAKAMCALTKLGSQDAATIEVATKMLNGNARFVVFAGLMAVGFLENVPDNVLPVADRVFLRSLQVCDYEFVGLFAAAYNRWLDNPEAHFEELLQADHREYLEIALEALKTARERLVALS